MNPKLTVHNQEHLDRVFLYALQTLSVEEHALVEAQLSSCPDCREELKTLRPVLSSFAGWSTDVLRPASPLWDRLAERIAEETGTPPVTAPLEGLHAAEWEEAAPGIHVRILASDETKDSVSMLVRLDPGTSYPGHIHAGIEELHLLDGVLIVDDRTLYPGDFIHAEPGSADYRVWSETGCTCFLTTSVKDELL